MLRNSVSNWEIVPSSEAITLMCLYPDVDEEVYTLMPFCCFTRFQSASATVCPRKNAGRKRRPHRNKGAKLRYMVCYLIIGTTTQIKSWLPHSAFNNCM